MTTVENSKALRSSLPLSALLLVAITGFANTAVAEVQNESIGFSPNHVFGSSEAGEHVDIMTGNLTLAIPIGPRHKLNDRLEYGLTLYYNSKVWEHECPNMPKDHCPGTLPSFDAYGLGASMIPGRIYHHDKDYSYVYRLQLEDGSEHFFCDTTSDSWNAAKHCTNYTTDSTSINVTKWTNANNQQGWKAVLQTGQIYYFGNIVDPSNQEVLATRIESGQTNANGAAAWVNYAYTGYALDSITDSNGTVTQFKRTGLPVPYDSNDVEIDVPAFGGGVAQYFLVRSARNFYDTSEGETTLHGKLFLDRIDYPHAAGENPYTYSFEYSRASEAKAYGWMLKRTLPTGASVDYFYENYGSSPLRPLHMELTRKVLTLPGSPAQTYTWLWERFTDIGTGAAASFRGSNPHAVRATDPQGNLTLYNFAYTTYNTTDQSQCDVWGECYNHWYDGTLQDVSTYAGPSPDSSRLIRRVEYDYDSYQTNGVRDMFQYRAPDSGTAPLTAHSIAPSVHQVESRTTIPGGPTAQGHLLTVSKPFANWNYGCPTLVDEYLDGDLYRQTYQDGSGENCINPTYTRVYDAATHLVSSTDRHYVSGMLECEVRRQSYGGTLSNCDSALDTGAARIQIGDVATKYTFDQAGSWVTTSITARGGDNSTTETRPTNLYYAQRGGVNTGYVSSRANIAGWKSLDRDVDIDTGLTSISRDPAGNSIHYQWDLLGRLKQIAPDAPEVPTDIQYTSIKETHVTQQLTSGNYVESVYLYDDLGRLITVKKRNATGAYDVKYTEYDIAGRTTRESQWAAEGTPTANLKWTTYDYTVFTDASGAHPDPLGRIHAVTTPDDTTPETPTTETVYDGDSTIVTVRDIRGWDNDNGVDASISSTTTYRRDGLGRLVSVDSPSPGADAQYTYDEADNLTEVRLTDSTFPALPKIQLRRFDFDAVGRLRLASNPENGTVQYTKYDSRGNLLTYADARLNTFNMTYDTADRLTHRTITYAGTSTALDLLNNVYDTGGGGSLGKLFEQESRKIETTLVNGVPTKSSAIVSRVRFGYGVADSQDTCPVDPTQYAGLNGRLSWQKTLINPWGAELTTDYCEDALGESTVTGYPDISGSGRTRTTPKSIYRNGYLIQLEDASRNEYLQSVGYAAGGVPTDILRGNNQRDIIDLDVRGRASRFRTLGYFYPDPSNLGGGGSGGAHGPKEDLLGGGWVWSGETIWDTGSYSYDMAGNVSAIGVEEYHYDALSRLVHGVIPHVPGGAVYSVDYGYDAFGNITGQSRTTDDGQVDAGSASFDIDWQSNRLLKKHPTESLTVSYQHDENGNLISASSTSGAVGYVFDGENRLRSVMDSESGQIGNYDYDASGYRVRTEANGMETYFFRDGAGNVLSEFSRPIGVSNNPGWNKDYVYLFGRPFAMLRNASPDPPKRTWATSVGSAGLTVNWDPGPDPDIIGFTLSRKWKCSSGDPEHVATPNLSLSIDDGTSRQEYFGAPYSCAANAPPYYAKYQVATVDSAGNVSDYGAELTVYPSSSTSAPSAPTHLTATPGNGLVTIRWDAMALANNSLAGYYLERKIGSTGNWIRIDDSLLTTNSYVDAGLANGTGYSYRAYAVDTAGRVSLASSVTSATPIDTAAPGQLIEVFTENNRGAGSVNVYWTRGLDPDISKYRVYRRTDSLPPTSADKLDDVTAYGGQVEYSYSDSGATPGASYFYSVSAIDIAGNVATTRTTAFSRRPRHGAPAVPVLTYASFHVIDHGTTSTDGLPGGVLEGANVVAEDDDEVTVELHWAMSSDEPVPKDTNSFREYRIYRKAPGDPHYLLVGTQDPSGDPTRPPYVYYDRTVSGLDYTYYVTEFRKVGTMWEESAAQALVGNTTDHAVTTFPNTSPIRNTIVVDGRVYFSTRNRESRFATVQWARVPQPGLVGYNVYRNCSFHEGCDYPDSSQAMENYACDSTWVRVNTEVIPRDHNYFEDGTTGGLQGCFRYAVRPVGPDGAEGPIGKIVEANLRSTFGWPGSQSHSWNARTLPYFPTDPSSNPAWDYSKTVAYVLDNLDAPPVYATTGINKRQHTGSPASPPAAPTGVTQNVFTKNQQANYWWLVKYARVSWQFTDPTPKNLLGFYVEEAGSPYGPWQRLTAHPIAWWERDYIHQGIGLEQCPGSYTGHTECVRYRVIAVDNLGNESEPVIATTTSNASCPVTLEAPRNLRASTNPTGGIGGICSTTLTWDAPPDANSSTEYYVYRTIIDPAYTRFYQTQKVVGITTYTETGDYGGSYGGCPDCTMDNYCPYSNCTVGATSCHNAQLDAYYVTARTGSGGESPRSNTVFWKCNDFGGYSRLQDNHQDDAIWLASVSKSSEQLACWETTGDGIDHDSVARQRPTALATASMRKLGAVDPPWELYHLHTDHLGSVRLVTSWSGMVVSTHDYLPFGDEIQPQFSYNTHQYTGHERDRESALDYMKARYFGNGLPRFYSADPLRGDASDIQSWNRFVYVRNNPLKLVDPKGMYWAPGTEPPGGQWGCHMCKIVVDPKRPDGTTDDEFKKAGEQAKQELLHAKGRVGRMARRLEASDQVYTVRDARAWGQAITSDPASQDDADHGKPTGGTTYWSPRPEDVANQSAVAEPDPIASLAHEFSHLENYMTGTNNGDPDAKNPTARANEMNAVRIQNLMLQQEYPGLSIFTYINGPFDIPADPNP